MSDLVGNCIVGFPKRGSYCHVLRNLQSSDDNVPKQLLIMQARPSASDNFFYSEQMKGLCDQWRHYLSRRSSGFPTRSDTNRPVQAQKRARSLKFWI